MARSDTRYLQASLVLASLMAVLFVFFLVAAGLPGGANWEVVRDSYPTISPDGPSYVNVTDYLRGEEDVLDRLRVSRPIVPLLALPLSYFISTELSFLVVNSVLFVLLVGVFFSLAAHLLGTSQQAFYSAILLIFAFPVYYRGINVTVDLASWLVFVVIARVLVHLKHRGDISLGACSLLAAVCGLGTLITELVFASFLLVLSFYLIQRWGERAWFLLLRDSLLMGASAATVVLALQLTIYVVFDYGLFDLLQRQLGWFANNPLNLGLAGFVRVLVGAFLAALALVPVGLFDVRSALQNRDLALAMLFAALVTLASVYTNSIRFVFVLFPVILPVAVLGVVRLAETARAALRLGRLGTLAIEVGLLSSVCAFNIVTYVGFLRYGSTLEMARELIPFLL